MIFALFMATALSVQMAMTPQERFAAADLVVHAEVTSTEVRWAGDSMGGVETTVWLAPIARLRGDLPEALHVVLPGGRLDEHWRVEVEDTPTLAEDRRYLLFLVLDDHGAYRILGGHQGATRTETPGLSPGPTLHDVLSQQGLAP